MLVVGGEAPHVAFSVGEDTGMQNCQKDSTIKLDMNVFSCANIKGTECSEVQKEFQPFWLRASEVNGCLLNF